MKDFTNGGYVGGDSWPAGMMWPEVAILSPRRQCLERWCRRLMPLAWGLLGAALFNCLFWASV